MSSRPVVPREAATTDIDAIIDHYVDTASRAVARRFIDALEATFRRIALYPAAGSPRYAHELGLPGLRFVQLDGFPHLVFYVEQAHHIDVWRVLHGTRDVPSWMREDER